MLRGEKKHHEIKMLIRAASPSLRNILELLDFLEKTCPGCCQATGGRLQEEGPQSAGYNGESAGSLSFFTTLLSKGITLGALSQGLGGG